MARRSYSRSTGGRGKRSYSSARSYSRTPARRTRSRSGGTSRAASRPQTVRLELVTRDASQVSRPFGMALNPAFMIANRGRKAKL